MGNDYASRDRMDDLNPDIGNHESLSRPADTPCPFCPPPADHILIERPLAFVKRDGYPLDLSREGRVLDEGMTDELDVLRDAVARLERAGIPYMLTGSLASSHLHGARH